ncbi:hypothetical protein A9K65_032810 (plasmid) [Mesorhizobium sp. WSM1497]|nr:hypothetical protein A9K65_032810 [Mesorhizobium sp. WSM1497]
MNQPRITRRGGTSGVDPEFAKKVKTFLIQPDGQRIVEEFVRSGLITFRDIVNIGYRKARLEHFKRMLATPGRSNACAERQRVKMNQPEKAWQHFLGHNEWILGFGLDCRFLCLLQDEAVLAVPDAAGRDSSGLGLPPGREPLNRAGRAPAARHAAVRREPGAVRRMAPVRTRWNRSRRPFSRRPTDR